MNIRWLVEETQNKGKILLGFPTVERPLKSPTISPSSDLNPWHSVLLHFTDYSFLSKFFSILLNSNQQDTIEMTRLFFLVIFVKLTICHCHFSVIFSCLQNTGQSLILISICPSLCWAEEVGEVDQWNVM